MSEPEGRGAGWTEERGTSDEGSGRLESGPEASGESAWPPSATGWPGRCATPGCSWP